MDAPGPVMRPPQRILLATDLSSHSDRALDRAILLARQWQATLHIVHALPPDDANTWLPYTHGDLVVTDNNAEAVERQVRLDLREQIDDLKIHVVAGEPGRVIPEVATHENCELIIMGAGGPTFAGVQASTTGRQLLRRSPQSVLIVKSRPQGAYERILIGTDFTTESRCGLETAAVWFADARLSLMHVLDIPYSSLLRDGGRTDELSRLEHETMASFVAGAQLPEDVRQRIRTHIEYGYPEIVLRQYGMVENAGLTVIGALRRGLAFQVLVGSNATRIVQTAPGDVLIVRAPRDV